MKSLAIVFTTLCLSLVAGSAVARSVEDYSQTINQYADNPAVAPYFNSAYGYAVFPNVGKGGVGIGGAHGKGQVYKGGKVTGFVTLNQLTIGLQLGGQAYSQVIFFEDERAYNDFISGNFEFDAQASAVAITASAQASTGTTGTTASAGPGGSAGEQVAADYRKGMKIFVIGKGGLMYQATIGGQKFSYESL